MKKKIGRKKVLFIFLNILGLLHSFSRLQHLYVYVYMFMFLYMYIERKGKEGGKTWRGSQIEDKEGDR